MQRKKRRNRRASLHLRNRLRDKRIRPVSRRILNDHLWTADEIAYQLSRGRAKEVETNRQQWESVTPDVAVEDSPTLKLDTDIFDSVKAMSLEQLQSKLREVNINPVGDEK